MSWIKNQHGDKIHISAHYACMKPKRFAYLHWTGGPGGPEEKKTKQNIKISVAKIVDSFM